MVTMRKTGGEGMHIPLIHPNKPGTAADITINVEEGKLYHLNNITFTGVKFFRTPEALMTPLFQMSKGDVFSTAKLRKGLENMRKLYGDFGFIDFVAEPSFDPMPDSGLMDMSLSVDEGKQFFVRRIDFTGNTTTRDKDHPAPIADRRRPDLQQSPVGAEYPAPQSARLFRAAEGRRRGRHQARHQDQYGGHHVEGEGTRQELYPIEWRRFRHRGQLHRRLLFHQQFPRSGRDPELELANRYAHQLGAIWIHRTLLPGQSVDHRIHSVRAALQLQSGARSVHPGRNQPDWLLQLAGHPEPAELHPERLRRHGFRFVSAEAQLRPLGIDLRLQHIQRQDLD